MIVYLAQAGECYQTQSRERAAVCAVCPIAASVSTMKAAADTLVCAFHSFMNKTFYPI